MREEVLNGIDAILCEFQFSLGDEKDTRLWMRFSMSRHAIKYWLTNNNEEAIVTFLSSKVLTSFCAYSKKKKVNLFGKGNKNITETQKYAAFFANIKEAIKEEVNRKIIKVL